MDERLRGHLYTREVWIQDMTEEDLDHGIDINELVMIFASLKSAYDCPCSVKLDRDRNSVMKKSDIEHMVISL